MPLVPPASGGICPPPRTPAAADLPPSGAPGGRGSFPEGAGGAVLAYGKPSHFFRFGVDCHHYGSGASGSRIPAANVDPSIPVLWRDPIEPRGAGGPFGGYPASRLSRTGQALSGQSTDGGRNAAGACYGMLRRDAGGAVLAGTLHGGGCGEGSTGNGTRRLGRCPASRSTRLCRTRNRNRTGGPVDRRIQRTSTAPVDLPPWRLAL